MENLTKKEIDYAVAKERVNQIRKFYVSLAVFIVIFAIYALRKYLKGVHVNYLDFNSFSIIFWIWGLILAIRGLNIFFFNHRWERKLMESELNK